MVILGERREREEEEKSMAMGPERSKQLHNFTMPCLKWGTQRFLRCMKVNPNAEVSADRRSSVEGSIGRRRESEPERRRWIDRTERNETFKNSPSSSQSPAAVGGLGRKSKTETDGDDGIEAVRTKLMFDLQTAADKMKVAILREGWEESPPPPAEPAEAEAVRPWNLRTRRAACKSPNGMNGGIGGGSTVNGGGAKNVWPLRTETKSPTGEKREKVKFSVSLSRREIAEDFMAMTGHRPNRRPKKRPKLVQKQIDTLFPGLWSTEVTAEMYEVPDAPETGKR